MANRSKHIPHNRFLEAMIHTTRYSIQGPARLAKDTGYAKSTISRLLNGQSNPSHELVCKVMAALENSLKRPLETRLLISFTGEYETSICAAVGCKGCLPDQAYDENDCLKPEFTNIKPGEWSLPRSGRSKAAQP